MKKVIAALVGMMLVASFVWAVEWVEGEVRRVDVKNAKVTIKHAEMKDLQMPAMTMVFTAKDPEVVKSLKRGQKIRFQASDLGGGKLQLDAVQGPAAQ